MNTTDEKMADKARKAFDQSVDGLDAATLSRLNRARQRALAERRSPVREWVRWAPATVAVAAVVVALTMLQPPADVEFTPASPADLEILLGEDSIEMLEELEFYSWLETQEENDG